LVAYGVRIWERWLKEQASSGHGLRLPVIVPVVLHHGEGGWTAARSLEEVYDAAAETLASLGEHLLRQRFVLDDLASETDAALRSRAMTALGRLVLTCVRHARDPEELVAQLGQWVDVMREVISAPPWAAALARRQLHFPCDDN
jgi:hypothetical protein